MNFISEIIKENEFKIPEKLKNFSIKTYQDSDFDNLIELYNTVFPDLKPKDLIHWKNKKNPFGIGDKFTFLIKDRSKIIGQYTVVPKHFYLYGNRYLCVHSMGTMTHPNYWGMGISTYLAKLTYEYAKRNGYFFVYGFPNRNSIYMFEKKLGWTNFGKINFFIKDISLHNTPLKVENQYKIKEIKSFDEEANKFCEKVKFFFPIIIKKDMNYLNWRFIEHPFVKYKIFLIYEKDFESIVSYFVLKKYKDKNTFGHIVDFLIDPRDKSFERKIFSIIENFTCNYFKNKASKISFWLPIYNLKELVKTKLGYKSMENDTYWGFRILNEEENLNVLSSPNNWYLTMSDSDVF